MRRTTLDLPEELWDEVDTARGEVARNRWIRGAIEMRLGTAVPERPKPQSPPAPNPPQAPPPKPIVETSAVTHVHEPISSFDTRCKHCLRRRVDHK